MNGSFFTSSIMLAVLFFVSEQHERWTVASPDSSNWDGKEHFPIQFG